MQRYEVTLEGLTPMIMHQDNLAYSEKIKAWQIDPANKEYSKAGDDRSPPWTWLGYFYHDGRKIGVPADNLMTCIREGGAKLKTGNPSKPNETYKKQTQSGILIDQVQFDFQVGGKTIDIDPLMELEGNLKFHEHLELVEKLGFELLVKRAKVGSSKHVRVRPLFRDWVATGTITVVDEELFGLTGPILERIFNQAGAMCGLCDWRVSSPKAPGTFGKFKPTLTPI